VWAAPRDIGLRLALGFRLLDAGRIAAADSVMRSVLRQEPRCFAALVGLSKAARARGDTLSALTYATRAALREPEERGVQLDCAADLRTLGRREQAAAILHGVLESEPRHVAALMTLGHMAREVGEREAAAGWFARAHAADPRCLPAAVALAEERRALGHPAEAASLLASVLQADPDHLEALLSLADAAWLAQDYASCLTLSQQAARAHPGHPAAPLMATRALMEQGRGPEALALLDPLGEAQGWPADLLARRAEILMSDGAWDAAAAVLDSQRPAQDGTFPFIVWLQRMRLALAVGAFGEAEALLRAAPARSPAELGWLGLLRGQLAEARWQLDAARAGYESALHSNPDAAWPHAELSRVTLLLCDLDACRAHLAAALRLDAAAHRLRGQSLNPGSTHVGQIWDEFRMDRPRAARLRALLDLPAEQRLQPLLDMIRASPGDLPAAMLLSVALRQCGYLRASAGASRPAIPRHIVQYWDEADPPPDIAAMMAGWRAMHPDFTHQRFDLVQAGNYLREHHPPEAVRAYARCRLPAQKADIFRLAYLAREGGIYIDADDRCLANLSPLLEGGHVLVAWQEHFGTLGNNFLAAAPGHPVLRRASLLACAAVNRGDQDIPWMSTGPGLLTRAFAHWLTEATDLREALRVCRMLERFEAARLAQFHRFAPYKRTRRHWLRAAFGAADPATADSTIAV